MSPDIEAIRQSPRQYVDLETVESLSDYAMGLEQQNLELLAAIERKRFQAQELMGVVADVEAGTGFDKVCLETVKRVIGVLREDASIDFLIQRDQRRDAALLRLAARKFLSCESWYAAELSAKARESGEWNPILEVK